MLVPVVVENVEMRLIIPLVLTNVVQSKFDSPFALEPYLLIVDSLLKHVQSNDRYPLDWGYHSMDHFAKILSSFWRKFLDKSLEKCSKFSFVHVSLTRMRLLDCLHMFVENGEKTFTKIGIVCRNYIE